MMQKQINIVFSESFWESLNKLPTEDAKDLCYAIIAYEFTGNEPQISPDLKYVWPEQKKILDMQKAENASVITVVPPLPPDIVKVEARSDRTLLLFYANGEKRLYDTVLLQNPVFDVLRDENVFMHPEIHYGTVAWVNGTIDIDPECLYEHSIPYED